MRALRGTSRAFRSWLCDTLLGFGPSWRASAASERDQEGGFGRLRSGAGYLGDEHVEGDRVDECRGG